MKEFDKKEIKRVVSIVFIAGFAFLVFCVGAVVLGISAGNKRDKEINEYLSVNDYDGAKQKLLEYIENHKHTEEIYYIKYADVCLQEDKWQEALDILNKGKETIFFNESGKKDIDNKINEINEKYKTQIDESNKRKEDEQKKEFIEEQERRKDEEYIKQQEEKQKKLLEVDLNEKSVLYNLAEKDIKTHLKNPDDASFKTFKWDCEKDTNGIYKVTGQIKIKQPILFKTTHDFTVLYTKTNGEYSLKELEIGGKKIGEYEFFQ